jgi:ATP-dependent DNA ligase
MNLPATGTLFDDSRPMPTPFSLEPMLCQSTKLLPQGRERKYELKLDGFRAIGRRRAAAHNSGDPIRRI